MKKMVFAGMVLVCGCLAPIDPSQAPLRAGSRLLGLNMDGSWTLREGNDATYTGISPEMGFLFADNVALLFTPFLSLESQEDALKWQEAGLLISGDYTFFRPGGSVHTFVSGTVGFASVSFDDGAGMEDNSQGFVFGAGGGVRAFHSSHCSMDLAVRWRHTTLNFDDPAVDIPKQDRIWVGFSVKLYFPVQTTLQAR